MRIACPECNAAYDVPGAQLAPGRGVRCARCGTVWVPVATEDAVPDIQPAPESFQPDPLPDLPPAQPLPPEPADLEPPFPAVPPTPDPVEATPSAAPVRRRRAGLPAPVGWLLTLLVLGAAAYAAVAYRTAITQAWPPAERAYALFAGQHPAGAGGR